MMTLVTLFLAYLPGERETARNRTVELSLRLVPGQMLFV